MRKVLWLVLAACLMASVVMAKDPFPGEPYYNFVKGEVLVRFTAEAAANAENLCEQIGGRIIEQSEELGFFRVALGQPGSETNAVKYFRVQPEVEWANFNYIARAFYTPNDTYYHYQWHYPRINMPTAWDVTRGSPSVVVAVVDMGFYFDHQDFTGVATTSPHDYIDGDNNPSTTAYHSHGAHVAGTIFAVTNNSMGVAGIAPLCTFMPIRALNDSGQGTSSDIANGISWAMTHGANVLNLSLGYPVTGPPQDPGPPVSTAIAAAGAAGVVICAASGNDGASYVGYPAAYTQCIAVGSTGYDDAIAPYSNGGSALDVVAPGGNTAQDLNQDGQPDGVLSISRDNTGDIYLWMEGTSMATPHVAGVSALLLSHGITSSQVRQALQETAVDLGTAGWDATFGWGRINAQAALAWHGGGGGSTTLLSEGFETQMPPQGWELFQSGANSPGWVALAGNPDAAGGTTPHGGSNAAFHNDDVVAQGDSVRDWLISPPVQIPANATSAQVAFFQRNYYMVPQYYGLHAFLYSTNDSTFHVLQTYGTDQPTWAEADVNVNQLIGQRVWFAFYYVGNNGTEWYLDDVAVTAVLPGAAQPRAGIPTLITLANPYPNPFNSVVQIPLEVGRSARVELAIFNVLGQRIATVLPSSQLTAGSHRFTWNAEGTASGLYFVKLTGSAEPQTQRLLLIK